MSAADETIRQLPDDGEMPAAIADNDHHESIWGKALYKFSRDRAGLFGFGIVMVYFVAALGVWFGLWGTEWGDVEGPKWGSMRIHM